MDLREAGRNHTTVGHGVADAAAERVHEVLPDVLGPPESFI